MGIFNSRVRRRCIDFFIISILAIFYSIGLSSNASAHAEIVSSYPLANSSVDKSPEKLTLTWSEIIKTDKGQIRILDASGSEITSKFELLNSNGATTATISPTQPLHQGDWSISWKVISADGHLISGIVPFTYGNTITSNQSNSRGTFEKTTSENNTLDRGVEAITWIGFITSAALLLAGLFYASLYVSILTLILLVFRLSEFQQQLPGSLLMIGEARSTFVVATATVITLLGTFVKKKVNFFLYSSLIVFSIQGIFSGHHLDLKSDTLIVLATSAHLLHIFAAALWFTAVLALSFNKTLSSVLRTRFMATKALFILLFAGPILAFTLVAPVWFSEGTNWLITIAIKSFLVLSAALIGLLHHRKSGLPHSEIDDDLKDPSAWRTSLSLQVALFTAIMVSSALLTNFNPPVVAERVNSGIVNSSVSPRLPSMQNSEPDVLFKELNFSGGYRAKLSYPRTLTSSQWSIVFTTQQPSSYVDVITMEASNNLLGVSGLNIEFTKDSYGSFIAESVIPLPGVWDFEISFYTDMFTQESTTTKIEIRK